MTFDAFETSVEDGNVIELYQFTQGPVVTRFTNFSETVTFDGAVWETTQISREDIQKAIESSVNELKIFMPLDNSIASQFIGNVPGKQIDIVIYRAHFTDPAEERLVVYEGFLAQAEFDGDLLATITVQPFTNVFKRTGPRFVYASLCNNILYDAGCKVVRGANKHTGLVSAVDLTLRTITVNGLSGMGAGWAEGGFAAFPAGGNDDQRLIVSQAGDTVTLLSNFSEDILTFNIDVFAGCAHDITTCENKFNNVINFGGYPFVPLKNPFSTTLRGGS